METSETKLCKCGCGLPVRKPSHTFLAHHYLKWSGAKNPNDCMTKEERQARSSKGGKISCSLPERVEILKHARSFLPEDHNEKFIQKGHDVLNEKRKDANWRKDLGRKVSEGMISKITKERRIEIAKMGSDGLHNNPEKVENWMHSMMYKRKPSGTRYEYKGILFRSKYEVRLAFVLDTIGFKWFYEPVYLPYKKNNRKRRYIPDFYIDELEMFFEVVGYFPKEKLEKLISSANTNNTIISVVNGTVLNSLALNNDKISFVRDKDNKKLLHANTEPSQIGNDLEGVETTIEGLKASLKAMAVKLHEQSSSDIDSIGGRYSPILQETVGSENKESQTFKIFWMDNVAYCPYIPLMSTPTLVTSDLFAQKGFLSSAGFKVINPGMYTYGTISGLGTNIANYT